MTCLVYRLAYYLVWLTDLLGFLPYFVYHPLSLLLCWPAWPVQLLGFLTDLLPCLAYTVLLGLWPCLHVLLPDFPPCVAYCCAGIAAFLGFLAYCPAWLLPCMACCYAYLADFLAYHPAWLIAVLGLLPCLAFGLLSYMTSALLGLLPLLACYLAWPILPCLAYRPA